LQIGIGNEELDPLDAGFDHSIDSVAATTSDADHFDPCAGEWGIIINENINACSGLTSVRCHS
jgi:hypothetical protein